MRGKNLKVLKSEEINKKYYMTFLYEFSSGNQVDGLPLALHNDAVSAIWPFSGRACDHTFGHDFFIFNEVFTEKEVSNH